MGRSLLRNIADLTDKLREHAASPALVHLQQAGATNHPFDQIFNDVVRMENHFYRSGIGKGDRVAFLAPNSPEWIVTSLAAIRLGTVVVPLDVQSSEETLHYILKDSQATLICTVGEFADRIKQLPDAGSRKVFLLDREEGASHLDLPPENSPSEQTLIEPEDPAVLFYTSGTTGPPKGVPLSHHNVISQINALLGRNLLATSDRFLLPLPLHHVYPFVIGMLYPLALGIPIILPHALTGPELVRALNKGQATAILGVPRLFRALYSGIESRAKSSGLFPSLFFQTATQITGSFDREGRIRTGKVMLKPVTRRFAPHLRLVACGGSALDPDLEKKLQALGWEVLIGYGLTETSPLLSYNVTGEYKNGTIGKPFPGVEIRIDPSTRPGADKAEGDSLSKGQEGEIQARGPNVFGGYHNLPEETSKAFTNDGWFRTGDLGYFDEEGFLHITGRVSTVIVSESGKNIQPEEVEEVYDRHRVISEMGILQDNGKLVGLVVPEAELFREQDPEHLKAIIRTAIDEQSRQLPSYKRISDYAITHQPLPRTRLGKIRRHELVKRYQESKEQQNGKDLRAGPVSPDEMSIADRALLENPAALRVWELLIERYPDRRLAPESNPRLDLGIDSLEWVTLTLEISESSGVTIKEEVIGRIETIRELLQEIAKATEYQEEEAGILTPLEHPEQVLREDQQQWLEPLTPRQTTMAQMLYTLNRYLMRSLLRVRATGIENIPTDRQFVLAPNHISFLDAFVIAAVLDDQILHRTFWAGFTGAAFNNLLNRFVSRLAKTIPIDPYHGPMSSIALASTVLQRGHNLVWFPEGARSKTGRLRPFKRGLGLLLHHHPCAVVPVFIQGTFESMPIGQVVPKPGKAYIRFGKPFETQTLETLGNGDKPQDRIIDALYDQVASLGGISDELSE